MKKCYIAYFEYEDDFEILGVYANRADAEEKCLSEYEEALWIDFAFYLSVADSKVPVEKIVKWAMERKGIGYHVEEFPILK